VVAFLRRHAEEEQEQNAEADREQHAVDVDRPEAHGLDFFGAVGKGPGRRVEHRAVMAHGPFGQLAVGQVLQVVLDVLAGGSVFRSHSDQIL
jgi:hypothetical protein